jgi:GT2 family glycosyltransferase
MTRTPALSVVVPTFNNVAVLGRCLDSWEQFAADEPVEVIVIEDGCRDSTAGVLSERVETAWGREHLRWVHENNVHELRATNRGFREAHAPVLMTWQDDMFLQTDWLVPELIASFAEYEDLGLLSLSRGLDCYPLDEPIRQWEDLVDWRRLRSTIGAKPFNWLRLQEVDSVIRPWAVRRACLDAVGLLDELFIPTEWDEADLAFRIRKAQWKVATHGYERAGAYFHLGSTTIGAALSDKYKQQVLRNGLLFHERWDAAVRRDANRSRKTWWRQTSPSGWLATAAQAARQLVSNRPS